MGWAVALVLYVWASMTIMVLAGAMILEKIISTKEIVGGGADAPNKFEKRLVFFSALIFGLIWPVGLLWILIAPKSKYQIMPPPVWIRTRTRTKAEREKMN